MYSHPSIEHLRPLPFQSEGSASVTAVPSEKPNITVKEGEGARYEDLSSDALQRLFRNTARVASKDALRKPWWVFVHEILAVGSTSARQFCRKANLDPDDKVSAA